MPILSTRRRNLKIRFESICLAENLSNLFFYFFFTYYVLSLVFILGVFSVKIFIVYFILDQFLGAASLKNTVLNRYVDSELLIQSLK